MEPSSGLIGALERDKIEQARRMRPEEKFWAGARLFDLACQFTCAGIRQQHPAADEQEVRRLLEERLALARRLEMP